MGLWKGGTEYYWADCILSSGEADIFPDKTKYADPSGCGFIKEGASVDMTQCDVRKGFICEHTNGKKTVKNSGLQLLYILMIIDISVNQ